MIKENNNWYCTDYDYMGYGKQISATEFKFIQAVWLDTCGDDTRAENAKDDLDNYAVCAGYINLDLYSQDDMECVLNSYNDTLDSLRDYWEEYANQIIAHLLFEEHCLYDSCSIAGVVSWTDAENIIQDYINNN